MPTRVKYTVTRRKPFGSEYHGPGDPNSKHGLSLYHLTNRIRGVITAFRKGHKRVDIDVMWTRDDVPLANHSLDAMGKEGFRDVVGKNDVPRTTIDKMTFAQAKQLRTPDGTPLTNVYHIFQKAKELDMIVAVDLKGLWFQQRIDKLVSMANEIGVHIYVKCDPRKPLLRWALKEFRLRGVWARYNGTGVFLKPLD